MFIILFFRSPEGKVIGLTSNQKSAQVFVVVQEKNRLVSFLWDTETGAFHVLQEASFSFTTIPSNDNYEITSVSLRDSLLFSTDRQICLMNVHSDTNGIFICKSLLTGNNNNLLPENQNERIQISAVQSNSDDQNILIYWELGNRKQIFQFSASETFSPLDRFVAYEEEPFFASSSSSHLFLARYLHSSSFSSLELFSPRSNSNQIISHWEIPLSTSQHGYIERLFIDPSNSKYLIVSNDHSLAFYDSQSQWIREESLASIHMAKFMEIPSPVIDIELLTGHDGIFSQFFHRILGQVENLKDFLAAELQIEDHESLLTHKDRFGFNKLLLLASNTGKLFCISNQVSHETLWTLWFQGEQIEDLLITRLVSTSDSVLLVLTKVKS